MAPERVSMPVLRRIFAPPVLWSGRHTDAVRRVTWVELFFDLVFVAAVAQVGTPLIMDYSIVAIMKGIQAQPDWTVPAAASAFLGIILIFGFWWGYFEGAGAATERHIESRRDARVFEIWNYAHLPLYLGLTLTAVGIEHIVMTGAVVRLHDEEAWILTGSTACVIAALTVLAGTSQRRRHLAHT